MIAFRDKTVRDFGLELIVHTNEEGLKRGINPYDHSPSVYTDVMKTQPLKQALDKYGFDAAFGGARRDEESSRAKERVFSFRAAGPPLGSAPPAPGDVEPAQRPPRPRRDGARVPDVELDRARRVALHRPREPRRRAAVLRRPPPTITRNGQLLVVDDDRLPLLPGEVPQMKSVRFRTLGCWPLTAAVPSTAADSTASSPRRSARARPSARAASSTTIKPAPWSVRSKRATSDDGGHGYPARRSCARTCTGAQRHPAPSDVRIGRRRQIDADRPPAVGCIRPL